MQATKEQPLILSLNDAAALLGISPWTLRRWAKAGKVPHMGQDGRYRFRRAELVAWAQQKTGGQG